MQATEPIRAISQGDYYLCCSREVKIARLLADTLGVQAVAQATRLSLLIRAAGNYQQACVIDAARNTRFTGWPY